MNEGISYTSTVFLFVLRRDILHENVNAKLFVNVVTNGAITFQFPIGVTTHTKHCVRSSNSHRDVSQNAFQASASHASPGGEGCITNSPGNHFGKQRFEGEGIV